MIVFFPFVPALPPTVFLYMHPRVRERQSDKRLIHWTWLIMCENPTGFNNPISVWTNCVGCIPADRLGMGVWGGGVALLSVLKSCYYLCTTSTNQMELLVFSYIASVEHFFPFKEIQYPNICCMCCFYTVQHANANCCLHITGSLFHQEDRNLFMSL